MRIFKEMQEADFPGQPQISLSDTDASTTVRNAGDLGDTQQSACCDRDASFGVQLAGLARVASAFGVLIYEMLLSRTDTVAAERSSVAGLTGRSVADSDREHQGVLRVVEHYLQQVCSGCGGIPHTEAELLETSAGLLQRGATDAYLLRQPVGVG